MSNDQHAKTFSLDGKVVLITGAAGGLGWAMTLAAARAGAHVVLNDRNADALASAVEALRAEGLEGSAAPFDVTDQEAVTRMIDATVERLGKIDVVVNNAGNQIRRPFIEYSLAEWRSILDVHLTGSFLVTQAAVRHMLVRGGGSIVMLGSVAVQSVRGTIAPYTAAKGGLTAMARALAVELGPKGIRCNVIAPGFYRTEFNRPMLDNPDFDTFIGAKVPQGRWGMPDDLGPALVYLASDAGAFVNGHTLTIDGGALAAL